MEKNNCEMLYDTIITQIKKKKLVNAFLCNTLLVEQVLRDYKIISRGKKMYLKAIKNSTFQRAPSFIVYI